MSKTIVQRIEFKIQKERRKSENSMKSDYILQMVLL